jgi:hypothetical protein
VDPSEFLQELSDRAVEGYRIFHVEDVAAIECFETRVWPSRGHLLALVLRCHFAVLSAKKESRAVGGEPVVPVIAGGASARGYDLTWFEGELPAGRSFAEGVFEVGCESRANAFGEGFACWELSLPCEDEGGLVVEDYADVLDDEAADFFRMTGGELVSVDAAEGVAQKDGVVQVEVIEEGFEILQVVGAGVGCGVVGVSVATLVECDEAPFGCEARGQRREGECLHDVRVESDEWAAVASRIEVGESQAVTGEGAAFHDGHDTKLATFLRVLNHAWYGWWKTGVVCWPLRWEN